MLKQTIIVIAQVHRHITNLMVDTLVLLMQIVGRVHQGRITLHGNKHFAQTIKTLVHLKHKHKHWLALLTIQGQSHKLEQRYAHQVHGLIG
jgi:hypothetical protein